MRLQKANTPPAQRCVTGWDGLRPEGAPEPNKSATARAEAYVTGLRATGVKPEAIKAFKLGTGGWKVCWRDRADRYARFFWNDPACPELLLLNEERTVDYVPPTGEAGP